MIPQALGIDYHWSQNKHSGPVSWRIFFAGVGVAGSLLQQGVVALLVRGRERMAAALGAPPPGCDGSESA